MSFAFVDDAETFYTATYPVVTSGKDSRLSLHLLQTVLVICSIRYISLQSMTNQNINILQSIGMMLRHRDDEWKERDNCKHFRGTI